MRLQMKSTLAAGAAGLLMLLMLVTLGCGAEATSGEPRALASAAQPCTASVVPAPEALPALGARSMLEIRNDTTRRLVYRAALEAAGGWRPTDVLPVMAGLDNFESWPTPLRALAVFDLREQ